MVRNALQGGIVCVALTLAGCSDTVSDARGGLDTFFRGSTTAQTPIAEQLPETVTCPRVNILPGTEVIRREDGSGNANLRWQASITKVARECDRGADGAVTVRVGAAGRVIQGPRGAGGGVELPLRVAVREGGNVTYSRLHGVSVALTGPSQDWAYVEENVVVTAPRNTEVLVGFDG
jgi:hypothetical protein